MRRLTTIVCSVCFLIMGFVLSNNKTSMSPGVATMNAAEPNNNILQSLRIPTDLALSQGTKHAQDTIAIHDTVYIKHIIRLPMSSKKSSNTLKTQYRGRTVDTLFIPVLYVPESFLGREEKPINDNHSTNKQLQDSCFCLGGNGLVH